MMITKINKGMSMKDDEPVYDIFIKENTILKVSGQIDSQKMSQFVMI